MIVNNIAAVREEVSDHCRRLGRDPSTIHLMAVTKNQDPGVLPPLAEAGLRLCGENRVEHLQQMRQAAPSELVFHFIGRIQSRQLKDIVPAVDAIHSLFQGNHIDRVQRLCQQLDRTMTVFIQVNTSGEPQKGGLVPEDLPAVLEQVRSSSHLKLLGLMCMAPDLGRPGISNDQVQACFGVTRDLAQQHGLDRLSMGMSGDYHLALAEGATDIRIGTRLFQS